MKAKHIFTTTLLVTALLSVKAQNGPRWSPAGNTASSGDFLGTTNAFPLPIKTNNITRFTFATNGDIIFNSLSSSSNDRILSIDATGKLSALSGSSIANLLANNSLGVLQKSGADYYLPSGNLGIGIAPSSGFKLDVIGDARISNNLYVGGGIVITNQVQAATQIKGLDFKVDNSLAVQGTSSFTGNATFDGNLRNSTLAGAGDRIIVADANGNLKPIGGSGNGGACNYAMPWYLGGNSLLGASVPFNNIGTCNNVPFVLKSNNNESIFIQPNSFVGIGLNNNNPTAALDITDGVGNSGSSHFKIYGDANGYVESDTHLKLVFGIGKVFEVQGASVGSRFLINPTGKVGVGDNANTTNNANLNVNVSGNSINAFEVYNSQSGLPTFKLLGDGKTNIITTNNDALVIQDATSSVTTFKVQKNGKTIIGDQTQTTGPHTNALLTVFGKMVTTSCFIKVADWADYVFANDYKVPNLYDVEKYYIANKHLPEIPSEKEVIENGIDVAAMNKLLLKKIEEMTILMVKMQKEIDAIKSK